MVSVTEASAPTLLQTIRLSLTTLLVSWAPFNPVRDTTGYIIYYIALSSGGSVSGSSRVEGGCTTSHVLTSLQANFSYLVSVAGTSQNFSSDLVSLCKYHMHPLLNSQIIG